MSLEGQSVNISSASVLTIKLCCDHFKGTNISVKGKRTCGRGKYQSRDFFKLGASTSADLGDTHSNYLRELTEAVGGIRG